MIKTETVTYGEIRNGDRVRIQGYTFAVENLRIAAKAGEANYIHQPPHRADVIRFTGRVVDPAADIARTGYNGGTYGGYADVRVAREVTRVR